MRKVLLVSVLAGFTVGFALPLQYESAYAHGGSGCRKAAKAQFPGDRHARKAFKKQCKRGGGAEGLPPPEVTK
jgi:hypothetical protein